MVKFYTAKMEIDKEFDNSINKIDIEESVIVTLPIISAVLTYFQLSF